ncbi:MAG TPA: C13 family peptidase [Lichenihabitans sp.]|nr:C13 family peptidase [Lichenihabitans sp.]
MRRTGIALLFVAALLAAGPAAARGTYRSAVVALALWSDPVFRSEATGAAKIVAARFGHGGPVVIRVNTPARLAAGPEGIASALAAGGRGLDPQRDVLFIILTSHGAPGGIAEKGGGRTGLLPPDDLSALLARSPVRHKVLIVSACFAGTYTALASDDTLVITAADATHTSFGCVPEARWTYFGDAFFNHALRQDDSILKAFADARGIVAARETSEGLTPSNPQIAGGNAVLAILNEGASR